MSNYVSVRVKFINTKKLRGQINHDIRHGRIPAHIEQSDSQENTTLFDYDKASDIQKKAMANRSQGNWKRGFKTDSAISMAGIITFSHSAQNIVESMDFETQNMFFESHIESLADELNTEIHGAIIHRDESSIH
ncbi:MAG: plasmid recombination protein, partial [Halothiobacillaceae bacterium]|nr:plasmid recombination protein [Halothiobacillaceae bacterium]